MTFFGDFRLTRNGYFRLALTILKNHYWSKSHQEEINKWFSGTEGSQATVFAKMMNANIEVMKTQLKAEDKIQRLHQSSRTSVSR